MEDNRSEDRVRTRIPVQAEGETDRLIDMSRTGISFTTKKQYEEGDPIDLHFYVGPRDADERLEFHCRGEVVRVEKKDDGWLVAGSIEWLDE